VSAKARDLMKDKGSEETSVKSDKVEVKASDTDDKSANEAHDTSKAKDSGKKNVKVAKASLDVKAKEGSSTDEKSAKASDSMKVGGNNVKVARASLDGKAKGAVKIAKASMARGPNVKTHRREALAEKSEMHDQSAGTESNKASDTIDKSDLTRNNDSDLNKTSMYAFEFQEMSNKVC